MRPSPHILSAACSLCSFLLLNCLLAHLSSLLFVFLLSLSLSLSFISPLSLSSGLSISGAFLPLLLQLPFISLSHSIFLTLARVQEVLHNVSSQWRRLFQKQKGGSGTPLMLEANGLHRVFFFYSQDNSEDGRQEGRGWGNLQAPTSTAAQLSTELDLNHKMGKGMSPLVPQSPCLVPQGAFGRDVDRTCPVRIVTIAQGQRNRCIRNEGAITFA